MIVETHDKISLNEYIAAYLRLLYRKPFPWIVLGVSIFEAYFLYNKEITIADGELVYYGAWFLIVLNFFLPIANCLLARKNYKSNMGMRLERTFVIDDEKIAYKADGNEGVIDWKYIKKYKVIKHFILLYISAKQAFFIKTDNLSAGEINFIKSKVSTKNR